MVRAPGDLFFNLIECIGLSQRVQTALYHVADYQSSCWQDKKSIVGKTIQEQLA